jgi:hypothetical protein
VSRTFRDQAHDGGGRDVHLYRRHAHRDIEDLPTTEDVTEYIFRHPYMRR